MAKRGFLIRNELSLPFVEGQELYIGLDHGRVGGRSADLLVGRTLTGAVVGLRGAWQRLSYDAFAGRPVGKPAHFQADRVTAGFNLTLSF